MDPSSPDPRLPVPNRPGGFMPRINYKAPEEGEAPAKPTKKTSPSTADKPSVEKGDEPKRVLKEATPELDTVEARRKIRLIVGAVAALVCLLCAALIVNALTSATKGPEEAVAEVSNADIGPDPNDGLRLRRVAAKQLLEEAHAYDRQGRPDLAVQRLERVVATYGGTTASNDASVALENHQHGRPMFSDSPGQPKQMAPTDDPPPEEHAKDPTQATAKTEKAVVDPTPERKALVTLPPPSTPPEPFREIHIRRDAADVPARPLPAGFRCRAEAGVHPSGWPNEITSDLDGMPMILVPAGTSSMGNNDGRPAERPEHQVELSAYYIDQHEVTARQFELFREATGKAKRRPSAGEQADADAAREAPAVNLTLDEARAYAAWSGKNLPSEAQWEKAARGTSAQLYPWGNDAPDRERPRTPRRLDPIESFPADLSPFGAFDMAGNASEWTDDWFEARAYQTDRAKRRINPRGAEKPAGRIPEASIRGGSATWEVTWRSGMRPEARLPYLGFRCVLMVEAAPTPPNAPETRGQPERSAPPKKQGQVVPF